MRLTSRRWLLPGIALVAAAAVATVVAPGSGLAGTLVFFALLWLAAGALVLLGRLWRRATYRVGVRLLISYLVIGVTPFVFAAAFAAAGLWVLAGQYTSVRFGSELRRVRLQLAWECGAVLDRAREAGPAAGVELLEELADRHPLQVARVHWQARLGGRELRFGGLEDLPEVTWIEGEQRDLVAFHEGRLFGLVGTGTVGGERVVALVPFDAEAARAISEAWWFDVALLSSGGDRVSQQAADPESGAIVSSAGGGRGVRLSVQGRSFTGDELWPPWTGDGGFLDTPSIVWFGVTPDVVALATGEVIPGAQLLALLRSSPRRVWDDFTLSRYELGSNILTPLAVLGAFFVLVYAALAAAAAFIILSITRSVRRLSAGAREVERGNLGHRVPVKRRDQLGDLARSFNHMAGSVQSMLADVAEKERLARELELAREIQESLLPARYLSYGRVSVRAVFQPAMEVGGDYFDVFPLAGERLVVAIGDVAGHGLSTGLLMASLKSSVAALVHEGYSGVELIERVNRLLLAHGDARTMVTLMVVELAPATGSLRIANAGHPPCVLLAAGEAPRELMMSSVPMGSPLCRPVATEARLGGGGRLVLYSDGLVEAVSPAGEPFGYERLLELLGAGAGLGGEALTSAVLAALADFTGGAPRADDLTLLLLEHA